MPRVKQTARGSTGGKVATPQTVSKITQEKVDECLKQGKICNVETARCVAPTTAQAAVRKDSDQEIDLDYGIVGRKDALALIRKHLTKKATVKVSSSKKPASKKASSKPASKKPSKKASSKPASKKPSKKVSSRPASRKMSKKLSDLKEVAKQSATVAEAAVSAVQKMIYSGPRYSREELLVMKLPQIKDIAKQLQLKKYQNIKKELIADMILATYSQPEQIEKVADKAVQVVEKVVEKVADIADQVVYTYPSLSKLTKKDLQIIVKKLGLKVSAVKTKDEHILSILAAKKTVQNTEKVVAEKAEEAVQAAEEVHSVVEEMSVLPTVAVVEPIADKLKALEEALEDSPNCVEKYACGMGEVCNAETGDCEPGTSHLYKLTIDGKVYHGSENTLKSIAASKNVPASSIIKVVSPVQPDTIQSVVEIVSSKYPMTDEEKFIYEKVRKCLGI